MNYIEHLRQMKNLNRFNGKFIFRSYNLLEHSFGVAALFVQFAKEEGIEINSHVIDLVMNHDMPEVVTTDLLHPIKHFSTETLQAWEVIEGELLEEHEELSCYSGKNMKLVLTEQQYRLFKACDYFDLFLFCREEINLGNNDPEINSAFYKCISMIKDCGLPKVLATLKSFGE